MTVREYIGARYVPLYVGAWTDEIAYEPLSIVTHEGNSYTSRRAVPIGIALDNEEYWVISAAYNEQIETYRQEVQNIAQKLPSADFDSVNTVKAAIDNIADVIPASQFDDVNTVKDYIDSGINALTGASFLQTDYIDTAVFMGDSVTYGDLGTIGGVQQGRAAKPYPTVYGEKAGITTINNLAVNGSTSLSIPNIADSTDFTNVDQVFIAHGVNDWAYSTPIGVPFRQYTNKTTFCGCLNYTINKILTDNPKCDIILCTPFYAQSNSTEFANSAGALSENNLGFNIENYANAVRGVANANNLKCVEMRESLGINNKNHATWINDDVHPNQNGYTMIGEWLFRQVSFASKQSSVTYMTDATPNGMNFIGANDFIASSTLPFSPFGDGLQGGQIVQVNNNYSLSKRYYKFATGKVYTFHCTVRASAGYHLLIQLARYSQDGYVKILERTPHITTNDHAFTVNTQFTVPDDDEYRLDINELNGADVYVTDISICEGTAPNPDMGASEYDYTLWSCKNRHTSLEVLSGFEDLHFNVSDGRCHIDMTMYVNASGISENDKLCDIPKCFAPSYESFFYAVDNSKNLHKIDVLPDGNIYFRDNITGGGGAYITLHADWSYRTQTSITQCPVISNQAV